MDFICDDLYPVLETDVVHSLQFLFLPYSSGWIVRVAENEGCGLLVSTLALEILKIYLVGTVTHTLQFIFHYFAAVVGNAGEEAVVHWSLYQDLSPGMQIAFRQQEMAGTTPEV